MDVLLSLLQVAPINAAMIGLAAMGGWASERGGIVNIALEGKALMAALAAAWVAERSGAVASVLAAVAAATLLSVVHWAATQKLRIDHVVSGMAINLVAAGVTGSLATPADVAGRSGATFSPWVSPPSRRSCSRWSRTAPASAFASSPPGPTPTRRGSWAFARPGSGWWRCF